MHILKKFDRWVYVLILGLANVISIGRIFVYARFISVEEFGYYATLTLVSNVFLLIGSLGFITELQKTLPIYFKKNEPYKVLEVIFQITIIVTVVFTGSVILCLFNFKILEVDRFVLFVGLLGGLSQLLFSIVTSETRAKLLLNKYSSEILFRNIAIILAGLAIIFFSKAAILIFLIESVITLIIAVLLFRKFTSGIIKYGFSKIVTSAYAGLKDYKWTLLLSMFSISILAFIMQNGERYLAKSNLTITSFAVLSFGLIVPSIANTVQAILNSSIFTNQVLRYSEFGKKSAIKYSIKVSLSFLIFFMIISIPMYFLSEIGISKYYPKYIEIVQYLPLIYGAFIIRSSDFISNIFIIINKPFYVVVIYVVHLILVSTFITLLNHYKIIDLSDPLSYFILNFTNAIIPLLIILFVALWLYKRKEFEVMS